jgi:FMN-dependent NADH-azoreductase
MNVLHVCANPRPIGESSSKQLAAAFFTKLAELNPDVNVTNVDLYASPPPYLSMDALRALMRPMMYKDSKPTDKETKASDYSRKQCEMVLEADVLVLTMPLWNASIPAIMKSWIDQIVVPGVTVEFSPEAGFRPLHKIRKVILLVASGAAMKQDDPNDALTPFVTAVFRMMGVEDVAVAWADGQSPIFYTDCAERKQFAVEAAEELAEEVSQMGEDVAPLEEPAETPILP